MRHPEVSCAAPGPGATTAAGGGEAVATSVGVTAATVITAAAATMIKGDLTIDNRTSRARTPTLIAVRFDWKPP
ncbi:hypothetical protein GCM10027176_84690 [Actinoallomurus bryophytorum]